MSLYRNVVHTPTGRFQARVYTIGSRQIYGGTHNTPEEAARAADELVRSTIAGRLNFPTDEELELFSKAERRAACKGSKP